MVISLMLPGPKYRHGRAKSKFKHSYAALTLHASFLGLLVASTTVLVSETFFCHYKIVTMLNFQALFQEPRGSRNIDFCTLQGELADEATPVYIPTVI